MGVPSINISFREVGESASPRGSRGIVALVLKDATAHGEFEVIRKEDIPEGLSDFNKEQIELAMIGYVTPPRKIIGYVIGQEEEYDTAQDFLESAPFNYVAIPEIEGVDADSFAEWIKILRNEKARKAKVVLPNSAADHEGVINFTTEDIETAKKVYTTAEYTGRIAGLLAGTPLEIASTFAPLPEVRDVKTLGRTELDKAVEAGEFALFNDGEKVKVARGVNSLVTLTDNKKDSFKKIKIVEAMDLIHEDVKRTAEDNYMGKYGNSYDNKCVLLMAIQGYFESLETAGILKTGVSLVEIDVGKQEEYLRSIKIDTEDMSEQDIKEADTGSRVFLKARIRILDAIEDIELDITI